jgi:hypothetical protein
LSELVVDACVALAWCFPDEASAYADGVLVALKGQTIVVPAVWVGPRNFERPAGR